MPCILHTTSLLERFWGSVNGRENLECDGALIRASLVVADMDKVSAGAGEQSENPLPRHAGSTDRPPRHPKGADPVSPLYSSGNRKRSLGVGPVSYAGEESAKLQSGADWEYSSRRPRSSSPRVSPSMLPAQTIELPPARQTQHRCPSVEEKSRSRPESAIDMTELLNLRDWNHTLTYELGLERSDLAETRQRIDSMLHAHAQEVCVHPV
jgi:hypothetical protein